MTKNTQDATSRRHTGLGGSGNGMPIPTEDGIEPSGKSIKRICRELGYRRMGETVHSTIAFRTITAISMKKAFMKTPMKSRK